MEVQFKSPETGEVRNVKVGFDKDLLWGIPKSLFKRGLTLWGIIIIGLFFMLALTAGGSAALAYYKGIKTNELDNFILVVLVSIVALCIYLGIKGSELTAKNYLANGWQFVDPKSDAVKTAKALWKLSM